MGEASKRIVKALRSNDKHRDGLELNGNASEWHGTELSWQGSARSGKVQRRIGKARRNSVMRGRVMADYSNAEISNVTAGHIIAEQCQGTEQHSTEA